MNRLRLFSLVALAALSVVVCADTASASIAPEQPDEVAIAALVEAGVICGLPDHAPPTQTATIEDDQSPSPSSLPCHREVALTNCLHDCCHIKGTGGLASASSKLLDFEGIAEVAPLTSTRHGGVVTTDTPLAAHHRAPELPPPTLL